MKWSNDQRVIQIVSSTSSSYDHHQSKENKAIESRINEIRSVTCPSCGHNIQQLLHDDQGGVNELPGLPAGVKFDPSDQEILEHLEAKVLFDTHKLHPLIDQFIPTLEGENGICYTHPEKLPGVSKDGQIRHFFHRPSKAYTTGTRKRRKVHTDDDDGGETRWHKTGKTRAVIISGAIKGYKKILVLYTNYGRQRKPEKTSWVMHQYHLGDNEDEKDGELVVSKVFYQTQPRNCNSNGKESVINNDDMILPKGVMFNRNEIPININNSNAAAAFVEYYNNNNNNNSKNNNAAAYITYDDENREIPPQFIPNLVIQGDIGSSFIHLPSGSNKGK